MDRIFTYKLTSYSLSLSFILLLSPMIKKESSQSKNVKNSTSNSVNALQVRSEHRSTDIQLFRHDYLSWAKRLATEQRYIALRLKMPQISELYRNICKKMADISQRDNTDQKKFIGKNFKVLEESCQTFLDSIVFMTDEDYLDSIGFDYNYVENPEKFFDLLLRMRNSQKQKTEEKIDYLPKNQIFKAIVSLEQWVYETAQVIWKSLLHKIKTQWDPKLLQEQKNQKKDFGYFWKTMDEEDKVKFLRFDCESSKNFQKKLHHMQIYVTLHEIESQIGDLMKAEKKDVCNRIFKWKGRKMNPYLCKYYQAIFNTWRQIDKTTRNKKKNYGRRKNRKNRRPKSIDAMSNETNETDVKEANIQFDIRAVVSEKLERDINDYSDQISSAANSYFQRRVLAFERLKYLLEYYGIGIRLYGSCACGIAIENSDLDVAVNDGILEMFGYEQVPQKKVQQALKNVQQILSTVNFTSDIKLINSAYIPIIKFKIDTTQQFYCQDQYLYSHLNRGIASGGSVQIDLTIQTKSHTVSQVPTSLPQHLGVQSTSQISKWLDQYPSLRPILLILKHQLTLNKLNETYTAGLNTYTLIVMLVSAQRGLNISKDEKIGSIMQRILRFWGFDFDSRITGVYLKQNGCLNPNSQIFYSKAEEQLLIGENSKNSAELEIRDPLNNGKIMTRNCYRFQEIQQLFKSIYNKCILTTQEKVFEICSSWNPKEQRLNPENLSEWVLKQLKGNEFEKLIM